MELVGTDHLRQVSGLYLFTLFYSVLSWPEVSHIMLPDEWSCLQPFTLTVQIHLTINFTS